MDSGLKTSFRASRPCLKHLHKRPSLARGLFLHLTEYDSWTETFTNESKKNQNIKNSKNSEIMQVFTGIKESF